MKMWDRWRTFRTKRDAPEYHTKVLIQAVVDGIKKLNEELALGYEISTPTQTQVVAKREHKYDFGRAFSAWLKNEKLSDLDVKRTLTVNLEGNTLQFIYFLPNILIGGEERAMLENEVDEIIINAFYSDEECRRVFQLVDKEIGKVTRLRELLEIPRNFIIFATILFCLPVLSEFISSLWNVPLFDLGQNVVNIESLRGHARFTLNMNVWTLHLSVCLTVFCAYLIGANRINHRFLNALEKIEQLTQDTSDSFGKFVRKSFFRMMSVSVRTWGIPQSVLGVVCPILLAVSCLSIFSPQNRILSLTLFIVGFFGLEHIIFFFNYSKIGEKTSRRSFACAVATSFAVFAWSISCFKSYILSMIVRGDEIMKYFFWGFFAAFYAAIAVFFVSYVVESKSRASFVKTAISVLVAFTIAKIFVAPNPPLFLDVSVDSGIGFLIYLLHYIAFNLLPLIILVLFVALTIITVLSKMLFESGGDFYVTLREYFREDVKGLGKKTALQLLGFATRRVLEVSFFIFILATPAFLSHGELIVSFAEKHLMVLAVIVLSQLPVLFLISLKSRNLAKGRRSLILQFHVSQYEIKNALTICGIIVLVCFPLLLLFLFIILFS